MYIYLGDLDYYNFRTIYIQHVKSLAQMVWTVARGYKKSGYPDI